MVASIIIWTDSVVAELYQDVGYFSWLTRLYTFTELVVSMVVVGVVITRLQCNVGTVINIIIDTGVVTTPGFSNRKLILSIF